MTTKRWKLEVCRNQYYVFVKLEILLRKCFIGLSTSESVQITQSRTCQVGRLFLGDGNEWGLRRNGQLIMTGVLESFANLTHALHHTALHNATHRRITAVYYPHLFSSTCRHVAGTSTLVETKIWSSPIFQSRLFEKTVHYEGEKTTCPQIHSRAKSFGEQPYFRCFDLVVTTFWSVIWLAL